MCSSTVKRLRADDPQLDHPALDWQTGFLRLLPAICGKAEHHFRDLGREARSEAVQEALVNAMLAYHRLAVLGRTDVAYATPLAMFACRQVREGAARQHEVELSRGEFRVLPEAAQFHHGQHE